MLSKSEQFELPLSLLLMEMSDLFQYDDATDVQRGYCHVLRWRGYLVSVSSSVASIIIPGSV